MIRTFTFAVAVGLVCSCMGADGKTEPAASQVSSSDVRLETANANVDESAKMREWVASFRHETLIRLPGPPASSTPATRSLVARGSAAVPFVLEGLSSSDPNVRRHSAFVMAKLRLPSTYESLRVAAADEFARIAATRDGRDPRSVAAPLSMMVIAMSQIDAKKTMEWLVRADVHGIRDVYRLLAVIVADPPVCGNDTDEVCRARLREWWQAHQSLETEQLLADQAWLRD